GAGFWFVIRAYENDPWLALALAIVLLADAGAVAGWPLVKHAAMVVHVVREGPRSPYLNYAPILLPLWRLVTPALSAPFLLLHVGLLARARQRPTAWRLAASGAGFGLLFYVYFYFWT